MITVKNDHLEKIDMAEAPKYQINDPQSIIALAANVNQFITERKLCVNISGRQYVNVEGWMYAGSQLGLFALITDVCNESSDKEYKYRATVELRSLYTGKRVGYGVALCSNIEAGKERFQEYACLSMAQTRAIGKAYRNILAWLIRAAGYEPTPAEEMDAVQINNSSAEESSEAIIPEPMITDKQQQFIEKLLKNASITIETATKVRTQMHSFTMKRASRCIDYLQEIIKVKSLSTSKTQTNEQHTQVG